MKKIRILCVCGSGIVSSSMAALKLKDILEKRNFDVEVSEASSANIDTLVAGAHFDLIACVSPVNEDLGIPKVNAVGLVTGIGEEAVIDECVSILEKAKKE